MRVQIKLIDDKAIIPRYAHESDAGCDLFSIEKIEIPPNESRTIPTGLSMAISPGWEAQVRSKSGLAANHQIVVLNSPGTIDSGYRGEIKVILINHGVQPYVVQPRQKIAQMVFNQVARANFLEVEGFGATDRGVGGFGSTGLNL